MATAIPLEMIKISIKKLLIWITLIAGLSSILIFSLISSNYMDTYFDSYIEEGYQIQINNIIEYGKVVLTDIHQQRFVINSYVTDPIYYIEILDASQNAIMSSGSVGAGGVGGHGSGAEGGYGSGGPVTNVSPFDFNPDTMVKEVFPIIENNENIGSAVIVRAIDISETQTKLVFQKAITTGALYATILAIIIGGLLSFIFIRYISRDTKKIMAYVADDQAKSTTFLVTEYATITAAVDDYRAKIAVKEKIRKEKFDRLLHDTKTPLTVLKSQLEGVVDGIITVDKDRAGNMVEVVDNLDRILWDVTNIIEGTDQPVDIAIETVDYSDQLIKIVNSLQSKFQSKQLKLDYQKVPFIIKVDVQMLNNVVYNILINSYKYTNDGKVTITAADNHLIIRDTGIGISQEDQKEIFKPYFRGNNVGTTSGAGLGLFNVKMNLAKMGAEIKVKSKVNEFTEFKIIFQ